MDDSQNNQFDKLGDMTIAELIEQFRNSGGSPRRFLLNLLAAQCFLGQAEAGAVLRVSPERNVDILALYPQVKEDAPAPEWLTRSAELAHEALLSDAVVVKPLDETGQLYGQPVERHLMIIPLRMSDIAQAVTAFVIGTANRTALEAGSQRLQLSVGMLNYSEMRPTLQHWRQSCLQLRKAMEIISAKALESSRSA